MSSRLRISLLAASTLIIGALAPRAAMSEDTAPASNTCENTCWLQYEQFLADGRWSKGSCANQYAYCFSFCP